ncbi:ATP-grasp domain-containing protein [Hamadaea tsunoensis]|uniref:ATP-grasp domain-containing protein n=1 Tax=Hamadaea tsunoensis TaxID=53368 RepID=UPI0004879593|nr:ATP-grasp domain-containing protein [Hamadaea tsunoensis]
MTIVFPPRLTASAEAIRATAVQRGLATVQLSTFAVPAGLTAEHLHAGPGFADAVAGKLDIALLEAPADWLARLPRALVRRRVEAVPISHAWQLRSPAFIKSPNDKNIKAMIYSDGTRLPGSDAVDADTVVLVSDLIDLSSEHRLFILDGQIHAASQYAEGGRLHIAEAPADALAFGVELLAEVGASLPSAVVIDVGDTEDGWAVIEPNAAWASGCYQAAPEQVLDVVLRAALPAGRVLDRDRPFVRNHVAVP